MRSAAVSLDEVPVQRPDRPILLASALRRATHNVTIDVPREARRAVSSHVEEAPESLPDNPAHRGLVCLCPGFHGQLELGVKPDRDDF